MVEDILKTNDTATEMEYSDVDGSEYNVIFNYDNESLSSKCPGRPPGAKHKLKDEQLLSLKKRYLGPGSPKKEKKDRRRPLKSSKMQKKESPTATKPGGRPKGSGKKYDENKTSLGKGDVSYTETVENILEEQSDSEIENMLDEEEQQVKKGRGRPRKIRDEEKDVHSVRKSPGRPMKNANEKYQVHVVKRSPGRPRKNPYQKQDASHTEDVGFSIEDHSDSENEYMLEAEEEQPVRKGRGRPRKIRDEEEDEQPKRSRVRPLKSTYGEEEVLSVRKSLGRSPKQAVFYTEDVEDVEDQSDSEYEYMSEEEEEQSDSEYEYMSKEEEEHPVKKGNGRPRKINDKDDKEQPIKKGRGRPRKISDEEEEEQPKKRSPGRPLKSTYGEDNTQSVRKSLGRSPKQAVNYTEDVEDIEEQSDNENEYMLEEEEEQPVKKGLGRPRIINDKDDKEQPKKKGRGRPRKIWDEEDEVQHKKRRPGRPLKSNYGEDNTQSVRKSLGRSPKHAVNYTEDVDDIKEQSDSENEYMLEEEEEQSDREYI
ncbi:unnamed protein product [Mytilus coruscus]|uniref:Uncharacterized protein n=1 Tax=Mytilus coruscus TaxID=42192 RepID=A0A6J8D6K5_MYTCO|nr:unnamed protein product [Mytilus coruscus]